MRGSFFKKVFYRELMRIGIVYRSLKKNRKLTQIDADRKKEKSKYIDLTLSHRELYFL